MSNVSSKSSSLLSKPGKLFALGAVAALCVLAASSASAAPTLINGSLTGSATNGYGQVPAGWTVVQPTPDTNSTTTAADGGGVPTGFFKHAVTASASPDGGTWVGFGGMTGATESFGQTVSGFTIGNSYTLSWYHANFGMTAGGLVTPPFGGAGAIEVLADGESIGTGALRAMSTGWVEESITFVAQDTTLDLTFQGVSTSTAPTADNLFYQSIDGIRLTEVPPITPPNAVPEPAALSLFSGAGLAMVLASRRRKQAKQAAA